MIQFDEATHTYTRNNQQYISVTTLLKNYNLSADYSNIPPDVLKKAAIRGTATHKELEDFIKLGIPGKSLDFENFNKYITARGIDLTKALSEEVIYDDNFLLAGTVDFQYKDGDQDVIADFKTTSSIHWESVSWQLSIYNYIKCSGDILMYYMKQLKVFHMYNGKLTVRDVPIIDYDAVVGLLTANLTNAPYTYTPDLSKVVSDSECVVLSTLLDEIEQCETLLKELKEKKERLSGKVLVNMEAQGLHGIYVNGIKMTYVDTSVRKTLDSDKVRDLCIKTNTDIDTMYKTSTTKAHVIIKKGA